MSDYLPDTPPVSRHWCPICEPEADPTSEVLETRYCEPHTPTRDGAEDGKVNAYAYLSGSGEVGGDENRRWCELLSRKKTA